MNKWIKKLTAALCAAVLMCGMAVTAYAGGGEEWDGLDPVEPPPMEIVAPGEGFTEDGNLVTRDLLYDKATNKQFITVQTSGGNTFYIVIDYDKPTDEDGEQYQTYFLNMVDEADLLAAMQAAGGELPECSCADKCAVGAINTDCTVCAVNMGECQGKAPEPAPVVEPEPDPEPEQPESSGGTLLLVLAVVVIGGTAGWYFKIYRPKKQQAADAAEDYGDDYDDTPPWEDEDDTESEGKVYNLKQMAAALQFMQEQNITEYDQLSAKAEDAVSRFHALTEQLRRTEADLSATSELMGAVVRYAKTRPVFDGYKAAKYSRKYLAEHEADLADYRAAKATMGELLGGEKLPKMAELKEKRRQLAARKKALYADYRTAQEQMRQAVAVKTNIDHLLGVTDGRKNKEQER